MTKQQWSREALKRLRLRYGGQSPGDSDFPPFQRVARHVFTTSGSRTAPFIGQPSLLSAPIRDGRNSDALTGLDVALIGVPMDLGVSNRPGARFGPRALRSIERIGPYNQVLDCLPVHELTVADIGDVPLSTRFRLEQCHAEIERHFAAVLAAGITPLAVGGDHSITLPILRAIGRGHPVGLVHIDAHCDTGGPFDGTRFHHGGPFRNAVLDGVLDPTRTIQIGIRGSSEYLWGFSYESGMTVIHAEEMPALGIAAIGARIREVVGSGPVYVSFDIDSLDPAYAPGTGTPELGGLSTADALALLRGLKGLNIVGADVVEVAPQYDATTNTAQAGAQMLFELLSLQCFRPRS